MSHVRRQSLRNFHCIKQLSLRSISLRIKTRVFQVLRHSDSTSPFLAWHFLLRLTAFFFQPRPTLGLTCRLRRASVWLFSAFRVRRAAAPGVEEQPCPLSLENLPSPAETHFPTSRLLKRPGSGRRTLRGAVEKTLQRKRRLCPGRDSNV